jgi:phage terminase large subunit GpA-like protein
LTDSPTTRSSREPYAASIEKARAALQETRRLALVRPPRLSLSEWAERFAYLSPETSAKGGKYRAFGYQVGMMDAITDPAVRQVTVMKSARVGYTKILDHVAGYFIHQDPSPVLIVQPRVEDAEDYSRTEIAPMLRDTPVLADIAGDLKSRDSSQRILKRMFRNGASLSFVGANSPGGFRRITARVVAFDEVDGYPADGAGNEGDQIALGTKRTETFWNRKIILGSTPTVKGVSRIEKAWGESDQRRYFVPCPHCGHKQTIRWESIRWNKDEATGEHLPDTAFMVCEAAGCVIEEHHKPWMIDTGEWIASRPMKDGHAGFHIWAGYSLFPNASWPNLVAEWLRVHKDPHLLRTFVNLVLGETWEEDAEKVDGHALMARCTETFDPAPVGVLVVTCGVDVQDDRLEVERVGWGLEEQSWSLDHVILYGDPSAPDVWRELDDYLLSPTLRADERRLPVHATAIDSGGHHTQAVYRFVKDRFRRRVYAIKGLAGAGKPVWPKRASKNNKGRINLFMVGVDSAKDAVYARLRIQQPGPGYCHFPKGREPQYFEQLTAEVIQTKYTKGFPTRVYVLPGGRRNEALDLRVYAYAALVALNVRWGAVLADQARERTPQRPTFGETLAEPIAPPPPEPPVVAPVAVQRRLEQERQTKKQGWLGGTRPRGGGWLR